MYVAATIDATSEHVFILGVVAGTLLGVVVGRAVCLHAGGSLTTELLTALTVDCAQLGCTW